jgi:hypothetical protein
MRSLLAPFILFLSLGAAALAGDPYFKRVWPEWRDADSFQSFYEDHTGKELVGKWTMIRSQPSSRSGLYFLTRINNPGAAMRGATLVLRIISPESENTRTFSFLTDVPTGSRLFEIGLTGTDWTGAKVQPVAWDMELKGIDGRVVARKVSFLWEKPEASPVAGGR